MSKYKYLLLINMSVFLFGLAGLFAKWIHIPALGITFGRVFFSSITLIIFSLIKKENIRVKKNDFFLLVISGCILALHWWSFLYSIQISTVAIGTITFSSFPLFITIINGIRNRKWNIKEILISLIIILGVIVTVPEISLDNTMFIGILIGILSALLYAILTIMNEYLAKHYSSHIITLYEQSSAAFLLLPCLLLVEVKPTLNDILLLVFLGVITTALAHTMFVSSLKKVSSYIAGIISSMETVYSILLAALFLREYPSVREIIGAIIIVGVVSIIQIIKGKGESYGESI